MNMGKMFYLGVALCIAGIVLMSLPERCVDCDDEKIPYLAEGGVTILHRDPDSDHIYSDETEVLGD